MSLVSWLWPAIETKVERAALSPQAAPGRPAAMWAAHQALGTAVKSCMNESTQPQQWVLPGALLFQLSIPLVWRDQDPSSTHSTQVILCLIYFSGKYKHRDEILLWAPSHTWLAPCTPHSHRLGSWTMCPQPTWHQIQLETETSVLFSKCWMASASNVSHAHSHKARQRNKLAVITSVVDSNSEMLESIQP